MSSVSVENLVRDARNGDKTAMNKLFVQFSSTVEFYASKNVDRSALTRSDLIQEGMIGLLAAVYGYRVDGGAGFRTYASACIANGIKKAVEKQNALKHTPLNSYVPLDEMGETTDIDADPQTILSTQYAISELNKLIETVLTKLERNSLKLHIAGHSNSYIAEILCVSEKSVDNALQRARKKLRDKWIP